MRAGRCGTLSVMGPALVDVAAAADLLVGWSRRTPCVPSRARDDVVLKLETLQPIGSFKVRGVAHAVLRLGEAARARGLLTCSAGNTAQALAWVARRLGTTARSVMPEGAPPGKLAAVRALGGEPVLVPREQIFRFMRERLWEREEAAFVHPWTDRDVMVGHGTLGLELLEQVEDLASVYVPVGGGGLLGGVAGAVKASRPDVRVVAVEPEGCCAFFASRAAGRAVAAECETACDGVAVPYMTEEVFAVVAPLVDDAVLVSEAEVRAAMRRLALEDKLVAEPSGALAPAAAWRAQGRGPHVAIVSGGSVEASLLAGVLGEASA